jgi:hypothetical protein
VSFSNQDTQHGINKIKSFAGKEGEKNKNGWKLAGPADEKRFLREFKPLFGRAFPPGPFA